MPIKDIPKDVQMPKCCPGKRALYEAKRGNFKLARRYAQMSMRLIINKIGV